MTLAKLKALRKKVEADNKRRGEPCNYVLDGRCITICKEHAE